MLEVLGLSLFKSMRLAATVRLSRLRGFDTGATGSEDGRGEGRSSRRKTMAGGCEAARRGCEARLQRLRPHLGHDVEVEEIPRRCLESVPRCVGARVIRLNHKTTQQNYQRSNYASY